MGEPGASAPGQTLFAAKKPSQVLYACEGFFAATQKGGSRQNR